MSTLATLPMFALPLAPAALPATTSSVPCGSSSATFSHYPIPQPEALNLPNHWLQDWFNLGNNLIRSLPPLAGCTISGDAHNSCLGSFTPPSNTLNLPFILITGCTAKLRRHVRVLNHIPASASSTTPVTNATPFGPVSALLANHRDAMAVHTSTFIGATPQIPKRAIKTNPNSKTSQSLLAKTKQDQNHNSNQ
ncbi:hypothetical protein VIGAN_07196400 [Vigna angularis var. angularis]|uniref:Uncharacterized protein n=1 Tax=Vigna angularis var. angularis TaxID=157739 RepID=A0A0S3SJU2_PHAAN|nr:hypothetical protein VIGAN_07196400 [Vigna angularis var. angularis]